MGAEENAGRCPDRCGSRIVDVMPSNRDNLATLYRSAGPLVMRRCVQMMGDPHEALDVTQWTFMRAVEVDFEVRSRGEALSWLYSTATRRCLWLLRNRTTRERLRLLHGDALRGLPNLGPESTFVQRDLVERVLGDVDERTGMIALLTWLQGLSNERAAEVCGVSVRTVGRARASFEERLRARMEDAS